MLILGHRGASFHGAPFTQNSLAAFHYAMKESDGFETDACLSADGDILLIHEADDDVGIRRHLNDESNALLDIWGRDRLTQLTATEVKQLRLEEGEPIPTLRETLEAVGAYQGKIANIELKGYGTAEPVLALLRDCFAKGIIKPESVLISSFHHAALETFKTNMPEVEIGALVVSDDEDRMLLFPFGDTEAVRSILYMGVSRAVRSNRVRNLAPHYLIMPEKELTVGLENQMVRNGLHTKLIGWTVSERDDYDQPDLLRRVTALAPTGKVTGLIADRPKELRQAIKAVPALV